jgi:uncharacterized protein with FMN-binding domain
MGSAKKIILSVIVIGLFAFYSVHEKQESSQARVTPSQQQVQLQQTTPTPAPSASGGTYKDGTYTGTTADAFYGPLQVRATIQNGKISDVEFLQYPNDRETSVQISNESMPLLKSEAITNQTAKVDTVTGATQTSDAFVQSLQSALDQAKV